MNRILPTVLLLCFFELSCTYLKVENSDIVEIKQLRIENDSLKNILIKNKEEMRLEINMVVTDAKEAGDYYKNVLNAEIISTTDNEAGMNETMMKLGEVEVRVLDENKDLGLFAPTKDGMSSMLINLFVKDIDAFFNNAINKGCRVLSPVQVFPENQAKNAVFADKFNHIWIVNQQY